VQSAPQASADDSKKDDSGGLFGPFRIGALVGGGLPEVLSLGGQLKLTRYFGAGINIGLIPTVKIGFYGDATLSYQEYDAYGRIYPFGGAFFVGAGAGYATVRGTLATNYSLSSQEGTALTEACHAAGVKDCPAPPSSVDVSSQASVRTLVLTPQIGFMHIFGSGFAIGLDVGAQIPIAPSKVDFSTSTTQLPAEIQSVVQTQYIDPNDQKVRSSLDKIGRTPLPTFNLKIGWFL
jgi:hypothetical protein